MPAASGELGVTGFRRRLMKQCHFMFWGLVEMVDVMI
jgi:hypothetical protein